jgi:hypothetical protein
LMAGWLRRANCCGDCFVMLSQFRDAEPLISS